MVYRCVFVRELRNRTFASVTAACPLARHLCQVLVLSRYKGFCCSPCECVVYKDGFCFTIKLELKKAKIDILQFALLKLFGNFYAIKCLGLLARVWLYTYCLRKA